MVWIALSDFDHRRLAAAATYSVQTQEKLGFGVAIFVSFGAVDGAADHLGGLVLPVIVDLVVPEESLHSGQKPCLGLSSVRCFVHTLSPSPQKKFFVLMF